MINHFVTDLDVVIDEISKKPFTKAGHYITAEKVPACTSVIIKNVPPEKCDEDTLDKKSGVDQYKSIANDTAVVDFEDEQSKHIAILICSRAQINIQLFGKYLYSGIFEYSYVHFNNYNDISVCNM